MYFVKILHSTAFRVMEEVQKERKSLKHQTACLIRLKKFWRQCSKTCFMTIYLSTTHDREKQKKIIVQFRITEQDLNRLHEYLLKTGTKSRSDFFREMILKKLKLS